MQRIAFALAAISLSLFTLTPVHAQEQELKNKGLFITPVRDFTAVDAGRTSKKSFTVANYTEQPMTISLSVEAFSVTDYAYDYRFSPPKDDWITLSENEITLAPNKSQKIPYTVTVPADAPPGGQYYTLFASSTSQAGGIKSQIRAATLLYLTVNGPLLRTGTITKSSFPRLAFWKHIPFSVDIKNTGNVHYFGHAEAQITGLFTNRTVTTPEHLLMPDAPRNITTEVRAPILPGIYRVRYGYANDQGQKVLKSQLLFYVPPWSVTAVILLSWLLAAIIRKFRARHNKTKE